VGRRLNSPHLKPSARAASLEHFDLKQWPLRSKGGEWFSTLKAADAARLRLQAMITLEDCIAMCGLSEQEVLAIAEHEHIPEIAAAALGQYLLGQERGCEKICDMLRDDIRAALARRDRKHALELFMALRHFLSTHPDAGPISPSKV